MGSPLREIRIVTLRTERLATITCKHYPILYFVLVFFQHFEEIINAMKVLVTFPEYPALLVRQLIIRCENRKIKLIRIMNQFFFPFAHFLTAPAYDSSLIN